MQRPRDTRRVFSKAWHMYMMVVVLSLLKPTCKGHMISAQVSVKKPNMHGMWHVLCLRRNRKRQSFALLKKRANHGPCHRCVTLVVSLLKKSCKGHVISWQFSANHGPCHRCVTLVVSLLKKSCKGHVIPAQFSANHGPCNRCVTLVVSLQKKSCKGHVISAFCKPWPNVHGSSSVVFAKTIMQRPRDTRRLFSKAWQWTW